VTETPPSPLVLPPHVITTHPTATATATATTTATATAPGRPLKSTPPNRSDDTRPPWTTRPPRSRLLSSSFATDRQTDRGRNDDVLPPDLDLFSPPPLTVLADRPRSATSSERREGGPPPNCFSPPHDTTQQPVNSTAHHSVVVAAQHSLRSSTTLATTTTFPQQTNVLPEQPHFAENRKKMTPLPHKKKGPPLSFSLSFFSDDEFETTYLRTSHHQIFFSFPKERTFFLPSLEKKGRTLSVGRRDNFCSSSQ